MNKIQNIGLNRAKLISVTSGGTSSPKLKALFLGELAKIGYRVENPEMFNDDVIANFADILETLTKMKGGDVKYVPLFSGFPDNVPDKAEFLDKRVIGFFGNILGMFDESVKGTKVLENGLVIPGWLFDMTEFGADPIFGRQTEELYELGIANQKKRSKDNLTQWTNLKFSTDIDEDVRKYLANNLYAKSSIQETLKEDIEYLIGIYGLDFLDADKVVFKEIKSYVMKSLWNADKYFSLAEYMKTPTDILRMFAAITDTDVSLATPIKFPKMKRSQRRFVLECLNGAPSLTENLNAYKGLWLDLGRYIHPGEYKSKYPNTFKAFDTLRNDKVITYAGMLEKFIAKKDLDSTIKLISKRPGVFGRKVHELLDVFNEDSTVIAAFKDIADQLELKNLLVLERFFATINEADYRTVINKKGKVIVFKNDKQGKISRGVADKMVNNIKGAIAKKLLGTAKDLSETKVYIDPMLRNYVVPLQQRKMSDGLLNIARGTKIKVEDGNVLRMFNYWKQSEQTTDFDLSAISFDENMKYSGHVSYTNLSSKGIVHSGDIQSAPHGAAEFIDIDLNNMKSDARYIGIQVYKYCGESFNQVEKSYTGWMVRNKGNSNHASFDIKTVVNKFNMVGQGSYAIPMVFDTKTNEITFIDLYMNGENNFNRVEGAVNDVAIVTKELINMINTRPNMLDLVNYQMNASNAIIVESKDEADISYGVNDCTYSVDRVDEILAELL